MKIKQLKDTECLETSEGLMRPLAFGEHLLAFHLEIPPHFNVKPHAHEGEGFLYCLSGNLQVSWGESKVSIRQGTAMLIAAGSALGVENLEESPAQALIVGSPPMVRSLEELKSLLKKKPGQKEGASAQ